MTLRSVDIWWTLSGEAVAPKGFFRALQSFFPAATTLFVEGCAIDPAVLSVYDRHREKGRYLPGRDTVFPRSTTRRCSFTSAFVNEIEALAELGTPALLDHLSLYSEGEPVVYWHDAFENVLRVNGSVAESTIASFASALAVSYERG